MLQPSDSTVDQNGQIEYRFRRAGIIGLGLIGGSLARALHTRAGLDIVALDQDAHALALARQDQILADGAVIGGGSDDRAWQLLSSCDIVFVCTPARTVPELARRAAIYCGGLITDVASVKKPIMDQVDLDRFVGGHPMAGSERQGYAFSSDILLENAIYVLCIKPDSVLPYALIRNLEDLIRLIGATPVHLDALDHDRAVAAVSHLPHIVAAGLSLLAARSDHGTLAGLAAGGFRDITRIASADPALWAGISIESRAELLPLLDQYLDLLGEYRSALASSDQRGLHRLFYQAAQYRNSLPVDGRGALTAHSSLTVYVPDRPGVLGHITTLLGEHQINISNIRIRELRTYEGGCLQLLLPDSSQAVKAAWLLQEAGYVCD
jgi:prephenate dehydrogenase